MKELEYCLLVVFERLPMISFAVSLAICVGEGDLVLELDLSSCGIVPALMLRPEDEKAYHRECSFGLPREWL